MADTFWRRVDTLVDELRSTGDGDERDRLTGRLAALLVETKETHEHLRPEDIPHNETLVDLARALVSRDRRAYGADGQARVANMQWAGWMGHAETGQRLVTELKTHLAKQLREWVEILREWSCATEAHELQRQDRISAMEIWATDLEATAHRNITGNENRFVAIAQMQEQAIELGRQLERTVILNALDRWHTPDGLPTEEWCRWFADQLSYVNVEQQESKVLELCTMNRCYACGRTHANLCTHGACLICHPGEMDCWGAVRERKPTISNEMDQQALRIAAAYDDPGSNGIDQDDANDLALQVRQAYRKERGLES